MEYKYNFEVWRKISNTKIKHISASRRFSVALFKIAHEPAKMVYITGHLCTETVPNIDSLLPRYRFSESPFLTVFFQTGAIDILAYYSSWRASIEALAYISFCCDSDSRAPVYRASRSGLPVDAPRCVQLQRIWCGSVMAANTKVHIRRILRSLYCIVPVRCVFNLSSMSQIYLVLINLRLAYKAQKFRGDFYRPSLY